MNALGSVPAAWESLRLFARCRALALGRDFPPFFPFLPPLLLSNLSSAGCKEPGLVERSISRRWSRATGMTWAGWLHLTCFQRGWVSITGFSRLRERACARARGLELFSGAVNRD